MTAILLRILAQWAWAVLVPFLFKLLERKLSPALMEFIYELIGERHSEIINDGMPTEIAEAKNLQIIREATKSSPGLSTTWARLLHTIAYMKWTQDNIGVKFDNWIDSVILWEQKAKYTDKNDLMMWYLSHPDWKKK